ncbi:integration host factor, actinobacterial type [Candidatus Oleimmundimicrobium sp.]|uniref:integration host factor, actinobacterial type n=1 Tax=Candidatus Oleimmundimicrobium sp. TaxID=3060597 RepID=UPI002722CB0E|nr:integration host factor, actinobacterial type [Candidatus Oleimmundimicrobium sp.]MDO8885411.1 integration host factor, actinobacterial type [Candidatus Oleimmundimicrobium sp.]
MALPQLSDADRKAALKKAVETRQKRAQLKAKIKKGNVSLSEVLNKSSDPIVGRMKVLDLLNSLPGIGKVRSQKIMEQLKISSTRRIAGLGSRQKEQLTKELA